MNLDLLDREVHIWQMNLDSCASMAATQLALLCPEERERAARLRFEADRERWQTSRILLRQILGRYTGVAPERLAFQFGAWGKPALDSSSGEQVLEFSLSHSSELAVLAVSRVGPLGIDVERLRPVPELSLIIQRFFSKAEQREFERLASDSAVQAFFTCWVRKEAVVKAIGTGLSTDLDSFDVSVQPETPARVLAFRDDPHEAQNWSLHPLDLPDGYAGCLALRAANINVKSFEWAAS